MVMGQMQQMIGLSTAPPWADGEDTLFHRMPLVFSQWYDWIDLTDQAFPDVRKSRLGTAVACPLGGVDCVAVSVEGINLIYNHRREIEQVTQGGQVGQFQYDTTDIGRPPGW